MATRLKTDMTVPLKEKWEFFVILRRPVRRLHL
jgi:hypothetical protein